MLFLQRRKTTEKDKIIEKLDYKRDSFSEEIGFPEKWNPEEGNFAASRYLLSLEGQFWKGDSAVGRKLSGALRQLRRI